MDGTPWPSRRPRGRACTPCCVGSTLRWPSRSRRRPCTEGGSMDARSRLIVALDVAKTEEALALVQELRGVISMFKVGLELIVGGGVPDVVAALGPDQRLFLDLKTPSDIPETVKRTVRAIASWPSIELLTLDVHT